MEFTQPGERAMVDSKNESRLDVRKVLVGGLLAWVIQALVMIVHRMP
jgi:hypothetical protein